MLSNYVKLCLLSAMLVSQTAFGNLTHTIESYIEKYRNIAITEMDRSGIPASIKLSQGILESSFGNSPLAVDGKNHFGVKCHKGWSGTTFWQWDDEAKPSCFRVYCNSEESYMDHTNFLMGRSRYASLFELSRTNYSAWARGLQRAGYATAPDYADKLIRLIDRYELDRYDLMTNQFIVVEKEKSPKPIFTDFVGSIPVIVLPEYDEPKIPKIPEVRPETKPAKPSYVIKGKASSKLFPKTYKSGIFTHNNVKMVIASAQDTPESIAKAQSISLENLMAYNDLQPGQTLVLHQYIYLEPKRSEYRGKKPFHKVKDEESMYIIAQSYGIKLNVLLLRNQMKRGDEPSNNEKIYLRGAIDKQPKLRKRHRAF